MQQLTSFWPQPVFDIPDHIGGSGSDNQNTVSSDDDVLDNDKKTTPTDPVADVATFTIAPVIGSALRNE